MCNENLLDLSNESLEVLFVFVYGCGLICFSYVEGAFEYSTKVADAIEARE
jgi:hypothetical protein